MRLVGLALLAVRLGRCLLGQCRQGSGDLLALSLRAVGGAELAQLLEVALIGLGVALQLPANGGNRVLGGQSLANPNDRGLDGDERRASLLGTDSAPASARFERAGRVARRGPPAIGGAR